MQDQWEYMIGEHDPALTGFKLAQSTAVAANPYVDGASVVIAAHDPATELTAGADLFGDAETLIGAIDNELDVTSALTAAKAEVDNLHDATYISGLVDAYESRERDVLLNGLSRMAAGYSDINATNSSAMIMGMANMEADHQKRVGIFSGELTSKVEDFRARMSVALAGQMVTFLRDKNDLTLKLAGGYGDHMRSSIGANVDEIEHQAIYGEKAGLWELNTYQTWANQIASIGSGTMTSGGNEKTTGSRIAGAASGAMAGAPLGLPGVIAGGVIGAFA
jgi:hypothetical protein